MPGGLAGESLWFARRKFTQTQTGSKISETKSASKTASEHGLQRVRLKFAALVQSLEQAARMIDWYRSRWEIEMFFHVLKNGCRIEALQLGSIEKIERALVLYMIVAWRIARLMRLGRSWPDLDAQLMFEPDEWKAAYILNQKRPPDTPPTLNEVVRLVARLGGFLARKGDGEPGVKTIWLGMQRILDFAAGIRFSRELQAAGSCV